VTESTASAAPMRSGLFVPIFDALADPALVARLSAEAEKAGWDGVFLWDHVRWREPILEVADAWITLAAIVTATQAIRLGPMVTPLARRRPVKVARETATLDRLSGGRLTLGVGRALGLIAVDRQTWCNERPRRRLVRGGAIGRTARHPPRTPARARRCRSSSSAASPP
jgi:alkanesulfonate monooxygenase SsuD/methylene tetrahydromethanopterin reductase-like flavin-dependent oxidoreductase (luciferase family)